MLGFNDIIYLLSRSNRRLVYGIRKNPRDIYLNISIE